MFRHRESSESTARGPAEIPIVIATPESIDVESWRADPDVRLMEKLRDGEPGAFDALFRRHSAGVVKLAFRISRSRERAEEMAQLVFLHLYRARSRYEPRARFLTYLYRITTNVCLNELRRREYSVRIEALDAPVDEANQNTHLAAFIVDECSPDPAEHVASAQLAIQIQGAIDELPLRQRSAFMLGRVEGLAYRDVAGSLDMSVSAVKSLIFRASAALRRELRPYL